MAEKKKPTKKVESAANGEGAKTEPKIVTPDEAVKEPTPEMSATEVKAALADVMGQAAAQTGDMLQSAEAERLEEAKPESSSYDPVMNNQRDFIPGTRRHDITRLPEYAYDENGQNVRRVSLPKEYHYVWVHPDKLDSMHGKGYRMARYDGGSLSGLAPGGLRGTNMFERTIDVHVRNGDTFLMFAPMRLFEAIVAEDAEQVRKWEMAAEHDHHNLGYRYGVRTFKEKDGQIIYN
jgi:hypothetical protein